MVEIIHLAARERAPKGELIIECKRGFQAEQLMDAPRGITWRMRREQLDNAIENGCPERCKNDLRERSAKSLALRDGV
jgi:hypothetical protein